MTPLSPYVLRIFVVLIYLQCFDSVGWVGRQEEHWACKK